MGKVKHKIYLQTTSLQFLENWSVQYLLESKFSYNEKYPLLPLGSFLTRSRNNSLIEDDKIYQRVTVKLNNGGIIPRNTEQGINIGTKQQYIIKPGQFLMSKIDARNGAFGLVPKSLDGAIVTNDFPAFDVKTTIINPQFLVLITTTKAFLKFAQSCSSGTTNRQRIDINLFLNVKIPLPPLTEQNRIVKAFNEKVKLAVKKEEEIGKLYRKIDLHLFEELKIKKKVSLNDKKILDIISFSDLNEWDGSFSTGSRLRSKLSSSYPNIPLRELTKLTMGSSPNSNYFSLGKGIPFIGGASELKDEQIIITRYTTKPSALSKKDDIIICVRATIGKIVWSDKVYCLGRGVASLSVENGKVHPNYLFEAINFLEDDLQKFGTGSTFKQVSKNSIESFLIPLPPSNKQKEIASTVKRLRDKIKELKQQAEQNRSKAINDFEKEVFIT